MIIVKLNDVVDTEKLLDKVLERAASLPQRSIDRWLASQIGKNPQITALELEKKAEKRFIAQSQVSGGATGATAMVPGVGTVAAAALTATEIGAFLMAASAYLMTLATLRGVPIEDKEQRKTILMGVLLGDKADELFAAQNGIMSLYWAEQLLTKGSNPAVQAVNRKMRNFVAKRLAARSAGKAMGRLVPFGVGAAFGVLAGRASARGVIKAAYKAFSPLGKNMTFVPSEVVV